MTKKAALCTVALAIIVSLLATGVECIVSELGDVTGSGKLETREMDYSDFEKVEASHAFEVDITRADSYRVSITADDNLFEYLDVRKTGKTLHLGLKRGHSYTRTTQKATITMPDLDGLRLSGASEATVSGFSFSHSLEFDLSGASSLDMDNLEAGDTEFDISGAGRASGSIKMADGKFDLSGASTVELTGSATDVSINASGASKLRLGDFAVRNADAKLSGASSATTEVSGGLDADLSGGSNLYYIGEPTMGTIEVSGGSELTKK